MKRWLIGLTIVTVLFCSGMVGFGADGAGDWPKWRGPNVDSVVVDEGVAKGAIGSLKQVWKADVGIGFSGIAVKGERVLTLGNIKDEDIVFCLNAKDGSEAWKYKYACKAEKQHSGPRSTPTVDGNQVYTFSRAGHVVCLDLEKGSKVWEKNICQEFKLPVPEWGLSSSVLVDGDTLVVNAGKSGVALNKKDGSKLWASAAQKSSYASVVPFSVGDKKLYAVFAEKALYAVDPKTGGEQWALPWKTSYDVNAADPVYKDGKLLISSGYERETALFDVSGAQPREIWKSKAIKAHFSSLVLYEGHVYGVDGNASRPGSLVCLDWATGAEKWRQKLGFGSLIIVSGKIVYLTEKGTIFVAEAKPDGYKEILKQENMLTGICWTPPSFAGGKLFCRSASGMLACFEIGK